jgi:uncharacterized repeat protein (TIGR03803 family)
MYVPSFIVISSVASVLYILSLFKGDFVMFRRCATMFGVLVGFLSSVNLAVAANASPIHGRSRRKFPIALLALLLTMITLSNACGESFSVLHSFVGDASDGAYPNGTLALANGTLYGTTQRGGSQNAGTVFSVRTDGTSYNILRTFTGGIADASNPLSGPTLEGSTLYGTTFSNNAVYSMNTTGGSYSILHKFVLGEGLGAVGGVTISGSTLYGTTQGGGTTNQGTVFSINKDGGNYTILHSFGGSDGQAPKNNLLLSGSTLYGTTTGGGSGGSGEVFAIDLNGGNFRVLHSFGDLSSEASGPFSSLTLCGPTLYGTTWAGGKSGGTMYSISTAGTDFAVLHQFSPGEGTYPQSGLTLIGSTFYGTAYGGGANGQGAVYSIGMDGNNYKILHSFTGSDGSKPISDLILDGSTLYGTTFQGGANGYGVAFSLTIPEPSSLVLLGIGAIGLISYGWRRRGGR